MRSNTSHSTTAWNLGRMAAWATAALFPAAVMASPLDPSAFTSQGNLSVASGSLVFDTDALTITGGGAGVTNVNGVLQNPGGGHPSIAVFDFSNVSIGAGVTIQVVGSNPLAILSQGNATIVPAINLSGANGTDGSNGPNGAQGNNGQDGMSASSSGGIGGSVPSGLEPGGKGGNGGYDNGTGISGSLGFGGALGGVGGTSSGNPFIKSNPGSIGADGANGTMGTAGGPAAPIAGGASFFLTNGPSGGSGSNGTDGRGGGGGGGGGGGSSALFANADTGGGGGSGGAGGLFGIAGGGGKGGGGIEIGANGVISLVNGIVTNGGKGGNGGSGGIGGAGGTGGVGGDSGGDGGNGGKGGNGGAGGPGSGGTGGAVYLHSFATSVSSIIAAGGAPGTNDQGNVAGSGANGLLKLSGTTLFNVNGISPADHDTLSVIGQINIDGSVIFNLANDALAAGLASALTLDSFFQENGGGVPDLAEFSDVTFSAQSPTTLYDVTLNPDRTFSLTATPEPGSLALLGMAGLGLTARQRRRCRKTER